MNSSNRRIPIIALARTVFDVLVLCAVTYWALLSFALPLPGVFIALGAAAATVLIWALFLSVRPVLHTDRYARAFVALVFNGAGAAAALGIGVLWIPVAVLFIVAAALNYFDVLAATKA